MKKFMLGLVMLLFFITAQAFAQPAGPSDVRDIGPSGVVYHKDQTIYWVETDDDVTVAWDAGAGATGYEVQVRWIRGDSTVQAYPAQTTTALQHTLRMPRAGIFIVAVRSYAPDPNNAALKIYSVDWARSNDPAYATVDGAAKAWIVIASIPAPGPIIP
jgi:hypothetical protein